MDENIEVALDLQNTNENIDWEARAKKAEAAIVAMKTKSDTPEKKEEIKQEEEVKEEVNIDDIIERKLAEKLAYLTEKKEEEEVNNNQKITASLSLSWEDNNTPVDGKLLSMKEYDKLSPALRRDYIKSTSAEYWEVMFK